MSLQVLGMMLAALEEIESEKLDEVSASEVLALIKWADGYDWEASHHPLSTPTPFRVLEIGIRLLYGLQEPDSFAAEPKSQTPEAIYRRQWSSQTPRLRRILIRRDGARCNHCGRTDTLAIDHIVPKAHGGGDEIDNLQLLCKSCNSSKGVKSMSEWLESRQ